MNRTTLAGTCAALAFALAIAGCDGGTNAQSGGAPVPYKLGTFDRSGQAFVGLVLKDTQIVDIAQAMRPTRAPVPRRPSSRRQLT